MVSSPVRMERVAEDGQTMTSNMLHNATLEVHTDDVRRSLLLRRHEVVADYVTHESTVPRRGKKGKRSRGLSRSCTFL